MTDRSGAANLIEAVSTIGIIVKHMLKLTIPLATALLFAPLASAEEYVQGPDSQRHEGVPQGKVTKYEWTSKIYPGTMRDYWVYVPAQYKPDHPACTMVFQDGSTFVNEAGAFRTTIVFDNLIHKGDMPVTIGVFINPGVVPVAAQRAAAFQSQLRIRCCGPALSNLSDGRDSAGGRQALQPFDQSGRPRDFRIEFGRQRLFQRGMEPYGRLPSRAELYRRLHQSARRSHLSVAGSKDGDQAAARVPARWHAGRKHQQQFTSWDWRLKDAGYDYKLVIGTEAHNSKHGSAILPDALRWLWRDYPAPIAKPTVGPRHFLTNNVVDSGSELGAGGRGL